MAELFGLLVIGIATALAMAHLVWKMADSDAVTLTDLLLMFLCLEVFAMVGQYLKAGQLPVRFPLYIAMVSIARDLILSAGANTELHRLASADAIALLAMGVLLIRYGQHRYPSNRKDERDDSDGVGLRRSVLMGSRPAKPSTGADARSATGPPVRRACRRRW